MFYNIFVERKLSFFFEILIQFANFKSNFLFLTLKLKESRDELCLKRWELKKLPNCGDMIRKL